MGLSAGSLFWNILTVDIFSIWGKILLTFFLGPDGLAKTMGLSIAGMLALAAADTESVCTFFLKVGDSCPT